MVLFIEHDGGTWVAKPDRPFGKLQLDLYDSAFKKDEEMFSCPLELEVLDNRIYVSMRSWGALTQKIEGLSLEEMEDITRQRETAVRELVDYASGLVPEPDNLARLFELYERAVSYFHFRWNFGNVADARLKQQLELLSPRDRIKAQKIFEKPELETLKKTECFYKALGSVKANQHYLDMFASANGELLLCIQQNPELWKQVRVLAEDFMHVHNEDIRIDVPYQFVADELRANLGDDFTFTRHSPRTYPEYEVELRQKVPDWDVFRRTIILADVQGSQKENEHHLQIRGQNRMKRCLELLALNLVQIGFLRDVKDVYEIGKNDVLELAEKVKGGYT